MNLIAGLQFFIYLILFGSINYFFMLKRYENDLKEKRNKQLKKIANLYPKGTFIKI